MIRVLLFFLAMTVSAHATSIVAKVNDDPISRYDLESYVKMVLVTAQLDPTAAEMKKMEPQILDQMIEQKVRLQAIRDEDITISDKEIDDAIRNIEMQSKADQGSLVGLLKGRGIPETILREKITADIGWFRILNYRFGSSIIISTAEIKAETDKLRSKYNKPHVFLYEIFLPVPSVLQDNDIYYQALDMIKMIKDGGNFAGYARQFSRAPSRDRGGEIGWMPVDTLPPEIRKGLAHVNIGEVADPIRTLDGYYIIMIKDRKDQLDSSELPKIDEAAVENMIRGMKMEQFSRKYLRDLMHKSVIEKTGM